MIRLEKMTPGERRWDGCHFPHSCLFMLNSPWVAARPWQNKIRAPFCTSISLSHGIGWQVSRGEKHCTLYSVLQCAGLFFTILPPLLFFLLVSFSMYLSIFIRLSASFPHTVFTNGFMSALFLPVLVSFLPLYFCFISLSLPINPSLCLHPAPSFRLSSRGTKVKNTERI